MTPQQYISSGAHSQTTQGTNAPQGVRRGNAQSVDLKELRRVASFNSHQKKDKDELIVVINNFEIIYCSYNFWRSRNQFSWSFQSRGWSSLVNSLLPAAAGASIAAPAIPLINNHLR